MPSNNSPMRHRRNGITEVGDVPGIGHNGPPSEIDDPEYWHALVDEDVAGDFLDVTPRSMQKWRQTGDGPSFVRISSRCIRYTRLNCRTWYEARLRASTSDAGSIGNATG